jgi:hypothetical protein
VGDQVVQLIGEGQAFGLANDGLGRGAFRVHHPEITTEQDGQEQENRRQNDRGHQGDRTVAPVLDGVDTGAPQHYQQRQRGSERHRRRGGPSSSSPDDGHEQSQQRDGLGKPGGPQIVSGHCDEWYQYSGHRQRRDRGNERRSARIGPASPQRGDHHGATDQQQRMERGAVPLVEGVPDLVPVVGGEQQHAERAEDPQRVDGGACGVPGHERKDRRTGSFGRGMAIARSAERPISPGEPWTICRGRDLLFHRE